MLHQKRRLSKKIPALARVIIGIVYFKLRREILHISHPGHNLMYRSVTNFDRCWFHWSSANLLSKRGNSAT